MASARLTRPFEIVTGLTAGTRYEVGRWLMLRLLGLVFLVAFGSLWLQVQGLIGPDGILPAGDYLAALRPLGVLRFWYAPTILWLGAGRLALHLACGAGVVAALALLAGVRPRIGLALCWLLYLSLVSAGQDFLSFQWDALLLETGLLALFIVPGRRGGPVPAPGLVLLWFLLFRLMFESGLVKLTSGDPTWRRFTALDYHFFTQPLPTWTAWYANLLPEWMKRAGVGLTFLVELGTPWLIFAGRRPRRLAFAGIVLLQALIAGTGNYTFFNLLTLALAVLLLDDAVWRRVLPARLTTRLEAVPAGHGPAPASATFQATALVLLLLGAGTLWRTVTGGAAFPGVDAGLRLVAPLQSVNGYGLFRVMTTTRPEIEVEGSDDGTTWRAYAFRDKPGDPARRPGFVEPHQPRLDWQMWFAALGSVQGTPWFQAFLYRLLKGSPDVLALLGTNPFPGNPPRYVRALLYDYRFTTASERRATGAWWMRTPAGLYCPPVHLNRQ